jgi:UDP-N-acetylmuramyl-tripeptide synthetase
MAKLTTRPLRPLLDKWGLEDCGVDEFSGVSYDSRQIEPGHIFFCIEGEKLDGNKFIPEAVKRGASLIVSEKPRSKELDAGIRYLTTSDVRRFMSEAADYLYDKPSQKVRLIGVTGTNGKTSTTHIVEHILKTAGNKVGLVGTMGVRWSGCESDSRNNELGYIDLHHTTPQAADLHKLLWEMVGDGVSHVSMEVSSHALALKRVESCQFSSVALTNITQDHLDFHKTMEHYWRSKLMLFQALAESENENRQAIVNIDQELAPQFINAVKGYGVTVSTYGFSADADYQAVDAKYSKDGTVISVRMHGEVHEFRSQLVGQFNVYNVLCALTIAAQEGVSISDLQEGIATFKSVGGRFEVVSSGNDSAPSANESASSAKEPLCIVDYAHSPDSVENVLNVAKKLVKEGGKLIAVFGCGGDRDSSKRPQMGSIAESLADIVYVTSDNPRSEDPQQIIVDILAGIMRMKKVVVEPDRAKAIAMAVGAAGENDVVVVAGKGHETYQILKDRTLDFDDRVEVRKALANRAKSSA